MPRWLQAVWTRPVLLLWLPPAFWAGNLVIGRAVSQTMPPVSLAVGRWLVALLLLLPFVAPAMWRQRALLWRHRWLIALCGGFGIAGYNALAYVALQTSPAANVAFLNSTLPLMIPLVAMGLGREPVGLRVLVAVVISFAGVAWIVARGSWAALLALQLAPGDLLVLLAVLNYALYSVLLRRRPAGLDALVFLAACMAAGLTVLLPFWIWELAHGARLPINAAAAGAVLYIGVFASLLAFILWNHCVARLGATVTGISFHLVAVFTALLAWLLLGEPIRGFHVAGIGLILSGFLLATVSPHVFRRAVPQQPSS